MLPPAKLIYDHTYNENNGEILESVKNSFDKKEKTQCANY